MEETMSPRHSQVLAGGIYQLLLQRRMLDVTITCAGEAIMAHKAVLVSYSKFLDTVFSGQGDDCDVLNMDNLGLDFEAIRAVIFFMYKGAVDTDRCGEEAFNNAARVLSVDTSTVLGSEGQGKDKSTTAATTTSKATRDTGETSKAAATQNTVKMVKKIVKDQMTMTDSPRILKLTRFTQTESRLSGVTPTSPEVTKKPIVASVFTQTTNITTRVTQGSQTTTPLLTDLGLKESHKESKPMASSPKPSTPATSTGRSQAATPRISSAVVSISKRGRPRKRKIDPDFHQEDLSKSLDEPTEDGRDPDFNDEIASAVDSISSSPGKSTPRRVGRPPREKPATDTETPTPPPVKRGRGRPRKYPLPDTPATPATPTDDKKPAPVAVEDVKREQENGETKPDDSQQKETPATQTKRGPGRPRKIKPVTSNKDFDWMGTPTPRRSGGKGRTPGPAPSSELFSEEKRGLWDRDKEGNFRCLQCDWSRTTSKALLLHLRIHLDERPFVCDTCGKGFRTSDKLKDHSRSHIVERPFPCEQCDNSFKTMKSLQRHKVIHEQDKYHKCESCPKSFYSRERLETHVNTIHKRLKKYACDIAACSFRAGDRKTILYHKAEVHGHPLPANLITMCDICGMSIRNSSLRMHMLIHSAKNLKCSECNFTTQYKNTLNGHMQRLHGINSDGTEAVKPYKCPECEQAFFSRQQLKFHQLRHQGAKPHKCPICNFSTVDKGSMTMHVRTHTGATPYCCRLCKKSFKQSSALSWHMKTVHEGVRRFSCEECQKTYVNRKDLQAHKFSVHLKIKPYNCPHCHYSCTKKDYLALHIERTHGQHLVPKELLRVRTFKRGPDKSIITTPITIISDGEAMSEDTTSAALEAGYQIMEHEESGAPDDVHPVILVAPNTLSEMEGVPANADEDNANATTAVISPMKTDTETEESSLLVVGGDGESEIIQSTDAAVDDVSQPDPEALVSLVKQEDNNVDADNETKQTILHLDQLSQLTNQSQELPEGATIIRLAGDADGMGGEGTTIIQLAEGTAATEHETMVVHLSDAAGNTTGETTVIQLVDADGNMTEGTLLTLEDGDVAN